MLNIDFKFSNRASFMVHPAYASAISQIRKPAGHAASMTDIVRKFESEAQTLK